VKSSRNSKKQKDVIAYVDEKINGDWTRYFVWYEYETRFDYNWPQFATKEEAVAAIPPRFNVIRVFRLGDPNVQEIRRVE
jgi:hypothetical protein